jgi:4-hydroxybenzoate polyprenyltransferase
MMLIIACIVWNMSMHAYSAIPDIEVDKKAGISTVATLYGAK